MFYWSGRPSGKRRETGVTFAISNKLVKELESLPTGKSDHLISLRREDTWYWYQHMNQQAKELFYHSLNSFFSETSAADKLILLGDFNARVGKNHKAWSQTLGKFGRDKWSVLNTNWLSQTRSSTTSAMMEAECSADYLMIYFKCNIKPKSPPMKKKGSKLP